MMQTGLGKKFEPLPEAERHEVLDVLRGVALFGVLIVNLHYFFRVSLFDYILRFHTNPGWLNHAVDVAVAEVLEFKAFGLFSLTFGVGIAVQAERAAAREKSAGVFLARRFGILLLLGLWHIVFISNVDILTLYALCGLVLIPFLRLPMPVLAVLGVAASYLPVVPLGGPPFPSVDAMRQHAIEATRVYGQEGFFAILAFRWNETLVFIEPLLIGTAQRTLGMMLLGVSAWRAGLIRSPNRFRGLLWIVFLVLGTVGLVNTTAHVYESSFGKSIHLAGALQALGSNVNMTLGYAAGLLLWLGCRRPPEWIAPAAFAGRMALSNYLTQTIVMSIVFYGYGGGLFGKVAAAPAVAVGVIFYAMQLWFSGWWLQRYRFGPFEWLWRSLTYGAWQPMRQTRALGRIAVAGS